MAKKQIVVLFDPVFLSCSPTEEPGPRLKDKIICEIIMMMMMMMEVDVIFVDTFIWHIFNSLKLTVQHAH